MSKKILKLLINVSNHPSEKWSEKQKAGWDKIVDLPFPQIPPDWNANQVLDIAKEYYQRINGIKYEHKDYITCICLQGEFTFCYLLFALFILNPKNYEREKQQRFAIPTTERKVVETQDSEGKTIKQSVFEFVKWRII